MNKQQQLSWVIPDGHRLGLKSRWVRAAEGGMRFEVIDPAPFPEEELVPLEVKKGKLVVLHGLLPHKSMANRSPNLAARLHPACD